MYSHNYKRLPYKESVYRFMRDYRIKYYLIGRFKRWRTSTGEQIPIRKINKTHLYRIVSRFGTTYIRNKAPYVWFRYLKEYEVGRLK